jgi:oligosaccharide repeat unit polymerase
MLMFFTILANLLELNIVSQLIILLLFLLSGMYFFKFEILHPFVWLSPFIILYNISIIILNLLDIRDTNISDQLILSMTLAVGTLFLYFAIASKTYSNLDYKIKTFDSVSPQIFKFLFVVLILIIAVNIILFLKSGITTKSELSASGEGLNLGYIYKLFLFTTAFLLLKEILEKKSISLFLISGFLVSLFIALILGERDVLMTFIMLGIFIYYVTYKPPKKNLYLIGILSLFLLPVLGHLKNVFTKDMTGMFSEYNALLAIFNGEFLSAGRNFETILNTYGQWDFFYGETIFWDLARSIIPGFIYTFQNSIGWFNNTFHPDIVAIGRGYGFSFIAEGYINFGYFGIVLWYLILSIIMHFLYKKSQKSTYWFIGYIYMIPYFIYIQRGDLSNFISPLLKQLIVFTIFFILINSVLKQFKRKKNIENINNSI